MTPQITHDDAARTLRDFVIDSGNVDHFDALDHILDELKQALRERHAALLDAEQWRKKYTRLASDTLRDQQRRALRAVELTAERGR